MKNPTFDPKGEAKNFTSIESQQGLAADIDDIVAKAWSLIVEAQRRTEVLYYAVDEDTQYETLEKIEHLKDDLGDIERAMEDVSGAVSDLDFTPDAEAVARKFPKQLTPQMQADIARWKEERDGN